MYKQINPDIEPNQDEFVPDDEAERIAEVEALEADAEWQREAEQD